MPSPREILQRADRLAAAFPLAIDGLTRLRRFRERRQRRRRATSAVVALTIAIGVFAWMGWSFLEHERSRPAEQVAVGGSLRHVLTWSTPDTCLTVDASEGSTSAQTFTLRWRSHVLVSFTAEWGGLDADEAGLLTLRLEGPDGMRSSPDWTFVGTPVGRTAGTVTWTFEDVPPGSYAVSASGRIEGASDPAASANLADCAMSVFAAPAVES